MGRIFKPKRRRPIPEGAEVFTYRGIKKARWKSRGITHTAVIKDGRIEAVSSIYRARWRDALGVIQEATTGCRDKAMAQQWLADKEAEVERIKAGVATLSEVTMADKKNQAIRGAVKDFKAFKTMQGRSKVHVNETGSIITRAAKACKWRTLGDMNTVDANAWIRARVERDGISSRTCQKTVVALRDFGGWCASPAQALLPANPFQELKWTGRQVRAYERRPITAEELRKIIQAARIQPLQAALSGSGVAGRECNLSEDTRKALLRKGHTRATVYQVMAGTGLRWNECRTLTIGDINLTAGIITLKAENEKNRKGAQIPLNSELKQAMSDYMAERLEGLTGESTAFPGAFNDKPFFDNLPQSLAKNFKKDCEIAKVKIEDASGRVIDLHSLRYFFGTELARAGVPITTTQKLMRHSTPHITAKVYVHATLKDKAQAVNLLPELRSGAKETRKAVSCVTPGVTPADSSEGQLKDTIGIIRNNSSKSSPKKTPASTSVSANDCRGDSDMEMVPRARIELATRGFSVRCSTN